jgi:hypothetical protein
MPLTDDELRMLINAYHPDSAIVELSTCLLETQARLKLLKNAGNSIVEYYYLPPEEKFPNAFPRLMERFAAALQEQTNATD